MSLAYAESVIIQRTTASYPLEVLGTLLFSQCSLVAYRDALIEVDLN